MVSEAVQEFFSVYKSVKFIRVENTKLACTYYLLLLLVFLYVALYTIWIEKGYQKVDVPIGTTSAKVKGTAVAMIDGLPAANGTVWNADDLVIPAETDALFVTTKYIMTYQERGWCEGNKDSGTCPDKCKAGDLNWAGNGVVTGNCPTGFKFCEVSGWCPLESEDDKSNIKHLDNVDAFTVFFKVNVRFPTFDVDETNAQSKDGKRPVQGYNLFSVRDLVEMAGSNYTEAADSGAILLFTTKYDCNLDKSETCDPEYSVSRIDNVEGTISPGFNFRSVDYNGQYDSRNLVKKYGIRVVFSIDGQAGKFDFASLTITLGAGLGFFGIATFICDYVLESCIEGSDRYAKKKYQTVSEFGSQHSLLDNSPDVGNMGYDYNSLSAQ